MRLFGIIVGLLLFLLPAAASADVSDVVLGGEQVGMVSPKAPSKARVASSTWTWSLSADLKLASVVADYQLENPGDVAIDSDFLFGRVDREHRDPHLQVRLGGVSVPFEESNDDRLGAKPNELKAPWASAARHETPIEWYVFRLQLPAHGQTHLQLRYDQAAAEAPFARANRLFGFETVPPPTGYWSGFGPVKMIIDAHPKVRWELNREVKVVDGEGASLELDGLPTRTFYLTAMSTRNLWFGRDESMVYWAMFWLLQALVVTVVVWIAGRVMTRFASRRRLTVDLLCSLVAFPMLGLFGELFPSGAFGYEMDGFGKMFFGQLLMAVWAPCVSAVFWRLWAPPSSTMPPTMPPAIA